MECTVLTEEEQPRPSDDLDLSPKIKADIGQHLDYLHREVLSTSVRCIYIQ